MPPTRHKGIESLQRHFALAVGLEPAEQERYLLELRAGDAKLAGELESLLRAEREADDRLGTEGGGLRQETAGETISGAEPPPLRPTAPVEGDRVGGFRLLEPIGRGGMASVFRAERVGGDFRQEVAVKILDGASFSADRIERFVRERRIVATLEHPRIARLIDGGVTDDGRPFLVLELVRGRPIDRYCDEERLPLEARVRLLAEVGEALQYAHDRLVVHRDLKPSNVMVDESGRVRLLDFGIAKELDESITLGEATRQGGRPLTPLYSSPELLSAAPITTASDQYQLGLLLFELVTGRCHHALDGRSPEAIHRRATSAQTPRPSRLLDTQARAQAADAAAETEAIAHRRGTTARQLVRTVRGDLDWIVLRALEKEPERRYPAVRDLVRDLRRFLEGRPIEARPPSMVYRVRKWVGRHRAAVALGGLLAVAVVSSAVWSGVQASRARVVREFSQRVEREAEQAERLLREAALQPLHDTTPERTLVLERLRGLEEEAGERGDLLQASVDYGIGRTLLALGDVDGAAERLLAAWEGGLRGAGIRYALGAVLGELYREDLRTARAIEDEVLASAESTLPPSPTRAVMAARLARVEAALGVQRGRSPGGRIEAGLRQVDEALADNPMFWGADLEAAGLLLLVDPPRLAEARGRLAGVLERNPPVEPTLRPLLELADEIGSGAGGRREAARAVFLLRGASLVY